MTGLERLEPLARLVRPGAGDPSTTTGRGSERYRRAILSSVTGGVSRVVVVGTSLVAIPVALGYLGVERYGLFAALTALTAMLAFADFGLGNGLMNLVAGASGRDDTAAAGRYVASALAMLVVIGLVVAIGFVLLYPFVPWGDLLSVDSGRARQEAGPAVAVFVACFVVGLPLGIVQRVQLGLQEGFHSSAWVASGSLLGLALLLAAVQLDLGLVGVVAALSGGPVLALAANWLVFFGLRRPAIRPVLSTARRSDAVTLARVGFLFFVLQLAVSIAYQSDVLVAQKVVGPEAAATYAVAYRLFFLAPALVATLLVPLWPAYAEAIARGDIDWVRATLRRTVAISLVATTAWSAFLLAFSGDVLRLWVGGQIQAPWGLTVALALWAIISTTFSAIAMLLNAANVLRFQVVVASLMAATSVVASILLANRFGVAGVAWGTLLAYAVVSAGPTLVYLRRLLNRLSDNAVAAGSPA